MNTSATLRLRGPCSSATLRGREVEGQGKRSVQAINNEQVASSCKKNVSGALYKGDPANVVFLYKKVVCNDTLGAKRYRYRANMAQI